MPSRLLPVLPRDPDEDGRSATPLELFFDLVFVVAVSVAGVSLHHDLTEAHVLHGLISYASVFFAIWWAWMNFTWFATSFDNDDWLYRVLTFVQMAGVLVLAAGISDVFKDGNFAPITYGYVIMRMALVTQWLRASRGTPEYRPTALRYAGAVTVVQVLWLGRLLLPEALAWPSFLLLVGAELSIPVWAERARSTPWHPHHITERFGLFTLILLGESLLGSANALIEALSEGEHVSALLGLATLVLISTASLWWIYFWPPHHDLVGGMRESLRYGYGHYFVFAAAGALSSGVEVAVDGVAGDTALSDVGVSYTVSVPIALFLVSVWLLAIRPAAGRAVNVAVLSGAGLVLLDPLLPFPVLFVALVLVAVVAVLVRNPPRGGEPGHEVLVEGT